MFIFQNLDSGLSPWEFKNKIVHTNESFIYKSEDSLTPLPKVLTLYNSLADAAGHLWHGGIVLVVVGGVIIEVRWRIGDARSGSVACYSQLLIHLCFL